MSTVGRVSAAGTVLGLALLSSLLGAPAAYADPALVLTFQATPAQQGGTENAMCGTYGGTLVSPASSSSLGIPAGGTDTVAFYSIYIQYPIGTPYDPSVAGIWSRAQVDWGDGTVDQQVSSAGAGRGSYVLHRYTKPGTFTVRFDGTVPGYAAAGLPECHHFEVWSVVAAATAATPDSLQLPEQGPVLGQQRTVCDPPPKTPQEARACGYTVQHGTTDGVPWWAWVAGGVVIVVALVGGALVWIGSEGAVDPQMTTEEIESEGTAVVSEAPGFFQRLWDNGVAGYNKVADIVAHLLQRSDTQAKLDEIRRQSDEAARDTGNVLRELNQPDGKGQQLDTKM